MKPGSKAALISTRPLTHLDRVEVKARLSSSTVPVRDGCWLWMGSKSNGYGRVRIRGRTYQAHRLAYYAHKGEIPKGLALDHLCRNPPCINPAHLEAVTQAENVRRGERPMRPRCLKGHLYDLENTYIHNDTRVCRECNRIAARAYYYRNGPRVRDRRRKSDR